MSVRIAIIGGTGVYDPSILTNIRDEKVTTPYGEVSLKIGDYQGKSVAFLNRHGAGHSVPPHLVNYRANIAALKELGVKSIFATAAVGSLNMNMAPGHFVFADQFLDFTKVRQHTFFEGGAQGVVHIDMTDPYCPELRRVLARAAEQLGLTYHRYGTYVTTEGPRFETPAEIKMYKLLGGDLVGMTSVPEVVLAREKEMCYANISMVTNYAAGISPTKLTHQEVLEVMAANAENLRKLAMLAISLIDPERDCLCQDALEKLNKE
ncbi:S-methyl-5'-thioadenosine phosphorylase [Desulforamulus hydrothermalis]|uniref:Probable 6-oxopurine nucleoside phosphorylase n=1 Tax=Desulforamulus hydrothermalis Lam5 = DSM 18033 TaxID=1121428 RepID=K8EIQ4_9FIRM|nr:S-methyl-5'-thioadenosine phosphorylase [Desulforamulus hydrothermalis]CCO08491.1 putative 6-oxopurine nucleoside phosphorylase [Desulforamulus hydrothermalis Lam5 = DSM 18033]SHH29487.1 methylthioadenosine phosphorylase [Desulforamulus hydrothermalis Lam5 = DSM 18033]